MLVVRTLFCAEVSASLVGNQEIMKALRLVILLLLTSPILSTAQTTGLSVQIKRLEGSGNMARSLDFVSGIHDSLFISNENRIYHPVYDFHRGPVRVEVLDESLVPAVEMRLELTGVDSADGWKMYPLGGMDTVYSSTPIGIGDEQLIPDWGMLAQVKQVDDYEGECDYVLSCTIEQSSDPWLTWLHDTDDFGHYSNWIRSGHVDNQNWPGNSDYSGDYNECFENILDGTWAPYKMASHADSMASPTWDKFKSLNDLENLHSVDVVITADQNKWTRCAVLEIADDHVPSIGNQGRFNLRLNPSVDKNGNPDASGTMGMSWFPGYAVNLETGERLNMAFGENSWLQADNGADMMWNPTENIETISEEPILGGGHYIYVFGHNGDDVNDDIPLYDAGEFIHSKLSENNYDPGDPAKRRVFKDAMWVSIPLLEPGHQLLESDVTVKLRVRKPYVDYQCLDDVINQTHPLYSFNTSILGGGVGIEEQMISASDVSVYPNPSADLVNINYSGAGQLLSLDLFDLSGKIVRKSDLQKTGGSTQILEVSGLNQGLYFIVVETDFGVVSKKLLVN